MKPILFSTPMVQAILDGRKTVTRRIIKPQPLSYATEIIPNNNWPKQGNFAARYRIGDNPNCYEITNIFKSKYCVGDDIWVRETWVYRDKHDKYYYRADNDSRGGEPYAHQGWKPSIFMPKEASRIFLQATKIRCERLHDITEEEAKKEGVKPAYKIIDGSFKEADPSDMLYPAATYRHGFQNIWYKINGKESWDENPWVWVIEFDVNNTNK